LSDLLIKRDMMELQEAILKRRSIRKFTDYIVTDDEVKIMLDAARHSQSWANTQVWEFIMVRDRDLIEKITATYSETNPARKCSLSASVLIAACAKKDVSGGKMGHLATKFDSWFMFDLGLAVQNLCLKAHEIGLGTVVVGFMDHDKCRDILSVPDGYEVVAVLPVGKPAVAGKEGPPRKELSTFTHLNRFGNPFIG
jgi:nitroreductase